MASESDLLLLEDGGLEIESRDIANRRNRRHHASSDGAAAAIGPDPGEEMG